MNQGEQRFGEDVMRWYKKGLAKEVLFQNGIITVSTFQNIVHTFCKYKDFDFGKIFIENNQNRLKENLKKDTVAYGWGLYYFYKKDLDKAIAVLLSKNWGKSHQLSGRNLLIRTLFENFLLDKDQYDLLDNALHAFEYFLMRTKQFPKSHLESHLNLIRILKALAKKINAFQAKEEVQKWLEKQLQKRKRVISKTWILGLEMSK